MVRRTNAVKHRRFTESHGMPFYGVKLYDPDSGEYIVWWSKDKNLIKDIYKSLQSNMRREYDDLHDLANPILQRLSRYDNWEWDYSDSFIKDGVHESGDVIDILYELQLR